MNTRFHTLEFALHACSMLWVLMNLPTSSLHCLGERWTNYAKMCMQPSVPVGLWHSHNISYFRAGCRNTREQWRKDVSMGWFWCGPSPLHPSSLSCIPKNSDAQLFQELRPRSGKRCFSKVNRHLNSQINFKVMTIPQGIHLKFI